MNETIAPLRVFLCHASIDKLQVRNLYHYLKRKGIRPWMASEDLLPGKNWDEEVQREIESSDLIIICLTKNSTSKEGYFQKEVRFALDRAKTMPEGQIFIIPVKLEDCEIPHDLARFHYWEVSAKKDYAKLLKSLEVRASQLGRAPVKSTVTSSKEHQLPKKHSISGERVLEAAIQNQVIVGKPARLFVWVRRRGSQNIISMVSSTDKNVRLDEENVNTDELEIEFPVKNGQTLPAAIALKLEAPEFEPTVQQKKISIPPNGDSEVCRFVVTPRRTGELLLNLEVLKDEFNVGSTDVWTTAVDQETKTGDPIVLMVVPIFVLVQAPPTLPVKADSQAKEDKKISEEDSKAQDSEETPKPVPLKPDPAIVAAKIGLVGVILTALIGLADKVIPMLVAPGITPVVTTPVTIEPSRIPTLTEVPPSLTPTRYICPYQGQTDNETIVRLIKAEASASNFKDLSIILKIFSPNAVFYDYAPETPKQWFGPRERYEKDLFRTTELRGVEHFDILPAGSGIDGNTAYYTSGSKGSYRIGNGPWKELSNGSSNSTEYGSEHWILEKSTNGCWTIIEMQFNAGDEKFP